MPMPEDSRSAWDKFKDAGLWVGDHLRYGVSPEEKLRLQATPGAIPGIPSNDPLDPNGTRYASAYLGAKQWGPVPTSILNTIAVDDIKDPTHAIERKTFGARGSLQGTADRADTPSSARDLIMGAMGPAPKAPQSEAAGLMSRILGPALNKQEEE